MALGVDVSSAPAAVVIRVGDAWPTDEEQRLLQSRLMADGHLTPDTRVLLDIRDVNPPGYDQAIKVIQTAVAAGAWPRRLALLVVSAVQYGFSRQLEALAPPDGTVDIFTDESEAGAWLRSPG